MLAGPPFTPNRLDTMLAFCVIACALVVIPPVLALRWEWGGIGRWECGRVGSYRGE